MRAFAFTGMPGAGKSEAVEAAKALGIPVVRMGDMVWEEVRRRDLPLTNENVGRVAGEMRDRSGKGVWAERTVEAIRKLGTDRVVIDGVRSPDEVEAFRRLLGHDFVLVAIHAAPAVRLARLLGRNRADDVKTEEEFRARDARELAWGIGNAIAQADVLLVNEGGVDEVRNAVARLLRA